MTVYVKQYGYKRSGTCYTTAVLCKNFYAYALVHKLGGKHKPPIDYLSYSTHWPPLRSAIRNNEIRVAVAIKNPYAAMYSFIRAHMRWRLQFRRHFLADPVGIVQKHCETWNTHNQAWLKAAASRLMLFRHEDLLTDFTGVMQKAQETLELEPRFDQFVNIDQQMTPNDTQSKQRFMRSFYRRKVYMARLGKRLRRAITRTIDWEFAGKLGYYPLKGRTAHNIVRPCTYFEGG